jgi:phosphoadenosine phosphosulfate reductase
LTIPRFPHPDLCAYVQGGHYRAALPNFPNWTHKDVPDAMRAHFGDLGLWLANGEKMCDAVQRRAMISACDGLNESRRVAYPLAHWNDREVFAYLKHRRIPLPGDYSSGVGGSWGGKLTPEWLHWMARVHHGDFARLEGFYPHIRAALPKPSAMKAHRI